MSAHKAEPMESTQHVVRRKGGPRSRAGCSNCKQRRIKCDEAKPSCQRCLKRGLTCTGYTSIVPDASTAGQAQAEPCLSTSAAGKGSVTSYAIPFRVPGSQADRQLLHYFCVVSASELSGYVLSDFWTRIVLQHAQHELVVRQAVVALSSVHQLLHSRKFGLKRSPDTTGGGWVYAPTNQYITPLIESSIAYNKALRSLRKYLRNQDTEDATEVRGSSIPNMIVPLICCAVFYCFESVQGNVEAAFHHLAAGRAMLDGLKGQGNPRGEVSADMVALESLMERMELQAAIFDQPRYGRMVLRQPHWDIESRIPDVANATFHTFEDAQHVLTRLQTSTIHYMSLYANLRDCPASSIPFDVVAEKSLLLAAFSDWATRFGKLLCASSRSPTATPSLRHENSGDVYTSLPLPGHGWGEVECLAHFDPASLVPAVDAVLPLNTGPGVLYVHYYMFWLILSSSLPEDPDIYNRPVTVIAPYLDAQSSAVPGAIRQAKTPVQIILDIAETIIHSNDGAQAADASSSDSAARDARKSISVETGLVAPLFLMIVKCDEEATVLRAVQLLQDASRREGLYDSYVVAAVANSVLTRQQQATSHHFGQSAQHTHAASVVGGPSEAGSPRSEPAVRDLEQRSPYGTTMGDLCELSARCPGGQTGAGGVDEIAKILGVF
ncbi:uncharacterized protein B0I36DRAFT_338331 [Microdochium trichocladiopsis]|uniref:Zn(2)-C6 fungal-type domain-containing protein n=1 Tax=Microdochium trichocladiopsis TaxID=1682393 RepID=A0A9P9BI90_9PEZI|nr:uncharacterized protein B0I36DRAFT_338331 [Microdochium trichocladiopsis]KAH7014163.1 hypothetical protein B0I36DRAFT_338331 [Microdochium trichocladiopsis]